MKKKIYNTLVVLVILGTLTSKAVQGTQYHPKNLKSRERANLDVTRASEKITIEKK